MYSIEPTSRPRVGCAASTSFTGTENSRATTTFCWLPPDSEPASVSIDGVRMSNSLTPFAGLLVDRLAVEDPAPAVRLAVVGVEDVVLGDGHRGDQPVATAVLGDVRDAQVRDLARRRLLDVVAGDRRLAGVERAQPGDRLDQLGLAVALDAGDHDDLAGPDVEVDAVHRELEAVVAHLRAA